MRRLLLQTSWLFPSQPEKTQGLSSATTADPFPINRRIETANPEPDRNLTLAELENLQDPFITLVLKPIEPSQRPINLQSLFDFLQKSAQDIKSFLVGDGSHIKYDEVAEKDQELVPREIRFAVAVKPQGSTDFDIFIVGSRDLDDNYNFLQVVSWDSKFGHFNYYFRDQDTSIWTYNGNSWNSLKPPTRGFGPFCGHINGSLVMKELRSPWNHWSSSEFTVDEAVSQSSPLRKSVIFNNVGKADDLERIIRRGIEKWTQSRIAKSIQNNVLNDVPVLLQSLFDTLTFNLITSSKFSKQKTKPQQPILIPSTFFYNVNGLSIGGISSTVKTISIDYAIYQESLNKFEFKLVSTRSNPPFSQAGDTLFAFTVPEPAEEDMFIIKTLVLQNIISKQFVAAAFMLDFTNPMFSFDRKQLLTYLPATATLNSKTDSTGTKISDLEANFIKNITDDLPSKSKRSEIGKQFLTLYNTKNWATEFKRKLDAYMKNVETKIKTIFDDYQRLAESRRRLVQIRPLSEFALTYPATNIPLDAPHLRMLENGTIAVDNNAGGLALRSVMPQLKPQNTGTVKKGCPFA